MKSALFLLISLSLSISEATAKLDYMPPAVLSHDLIINEIMARPSTKNGLPDAEYVEIYNRGKQVIGLKGLVYRSTNVSYTFKEGNINPHEYLILCKTSDTLIMKSYGHVIGLTSWPTLTNTGTTLSLLSEAGDLIDEVNYNENWYGLPGKRAGGWSLERRDFDAFCLGYTNWSASINNVGGTPGQENSIYAKQRLPSFLTELTPINEHQLKVHFNLLIDTAYAKQPSLYRLNNGIEKPTTVEIIDQQTLVLHFQASFSKGVQYQLRATEMRNCAGIIQESKAIFLLGQKIEAHDILLNEILPNPKSGGVEFVEIYNNTQKDLDLQDLQIARMIDKDSLTNPKTLSTASLIMRPKAYLLLSENAEIVKQQYYTENPDAFLSLTDMPQLPNESGTVVLISGNQVIDRLDYKEDMHAAFIKNPKGVSLERRQFTAPTNAKGNFTSAAAAVNYATPGYQNSQYSEEQVIDTEPIQLISKTFSPDNDSFEDVLQIKYTFTKAGQMANLVVFNDRGRPVRKLYQNYLLANHGLLEWDGLMDNGMLAQVGIYMLWIEIYNEQGAVRHYRKSFVLAEKF